MLYHLEFESRSIIKMVRIKELRIGKAHVEYTFTCAAAHAVNYKTYMYNTY